MHSTVAPVRLLFQTRLCGKGHLLIAVSLKTPDEEGDPEQRKKLIHVSRCVTQHPQGDLRTVCQRPEAHVLRLAFALDVEYPLQGEALFNVGLSALYQQPFHDRGDPS